MLEWKHSAAFLILPYVTAKSHLNSVDGTHDNDSDEYLPMILEDFG